MKANTRAQKKALLYNGHNRKPGVAQHNRELRWRLRRRRIARWLRGEAA